MSKPDIYNLPVMPAPVRTVRPKRSNQRSRGQSNSKRPTVDPRQTFTASDLMHYTDPSPQLWRWALGLGQHAWNEIIRQRGQIDGFAAPNLAGQDLRGRDLSRYNFAGASFRGAMLQATDLSYTDLSDCDFRRADMQGANLQSARLHQTVLANACLDGANLYFAQLSSMSLMCGHRQLRVRGLKLRHATFTDCEILGWQLDAAQADGAAFVRCTFRRHSPYIDSEEPGQNVRLAGWATSVKFIDCDVWSLDLDLGERCKIEHQGGSHLHAHIVRAAEIKLDPNLDQLSLAVDMPPQALRLPAFTDTQWVNERLTATKRARIEIGYLHEWDWSMQAERLRRARENMVKDKLPWWANQRALGTAGAHDDKRRVGTAAGRDCRGIHPNFVDAKLLTHGRASTMASVKTRRFRYVISPCYAFGVVDKLVHRRLPVLLGRTAERLPQGAIARFLRSQAKRLEQTSPRWGLLACWRQAYQVRVQPWAKSCRGWGADQRDAAVAGGQAWINRLQPQPTPAESEHPVSSTRAS